jgi:hypothetical protein
VGALSSRSWTVSLALAVALPLAGCFDLPKIDPGPRLVDDFAGDTPTWTRFAGWTCTTFSPDAPATADADAGTPDFGTADCSFVSPGDGDARALSVTFDVVDPPDGIRQRPAADIFTHTTSGTVDLNAFTQLVFFATLGGSPPVGTHLLVELGCSSLHDPIASEVVTEDLATGDWVPVPLTLADITQSTTMHNQACLAQIDSIHFVVDFSPALNDGESASGTLQIDNIRLQN